MRVVRVAAQTQLAEDEWEEMEEEWERVKAWPQRVVWGAVRREERTEIGIRCPF